jgi:hypothetical protein
MAKRCVRLRRQIVWPASKESAARRVDEWIASPI